MDASRDARTDFGVAGRQIAVLYPAFRCGTWCPLALMESADPRLISPVGFSPYDRYRLGGSRSDLFAITSCRALRNLSAATSCVGSSSRCQPWLGRLADEVRLVRPVMGQQGPDRARRLVGQRHRDHVGRAALGQSHRPFGWRLGGGEHGAGFVDQQGSQIPVPALLYSGCLSQGLLLPYFLPCAPYGRYRSMGVVLLFVISSGYWLSTRWDRKTRRNNLGGALSPSSTGRDQRGERTHLVLRPHGDIFRLRGSSQVSLWVAPSLLFRGGFRRPPQRRRHRGSTGTRCHPSRCGAGPRQVGGPAQLSPAPSRDASPLAWPTP